MHSLDNLHNVKGAKTEGFRVGRGPVPETARPPAKA